MTKAFRVLARTMALIGVMSLQLACAVTSPTVDLALVAPWSAPDLLVEIAETVATEHKDVYFELITELVSLDHDLSPRALYHEAITSVSRLIGQDNIATVKLGLAVHAAAPRIEAYHQFYRQVPEPACAVWAQVGSRREAICTPKDITRYWDDAGDVPLLPFDHVLRAPKATEKSIVVYTTDLSGNFATFHTILTEAVRTQNINYVIRYKPSVETKRTSEASLYLSGYGVELALKNTDYLVIDDRDNKGEHEPRKKSMREKLTGLGKKISESLFDHAEQVPTIEPLAANEIADLGLKAVSLITKAKDPLSSLIHASQDFPKYAAQISRMEQVEDSIVEVLTANHRILSPGTNAMWLNGRSVQEDKADPFFLVRTLHHEKNLMQTFAKFGWSAQQALGFLSHPALAKDEADSSDITKDIYDVRSDAVLWWNDIEKDQRYKPWGSSLYDLLRPVYPGQMRPIRRNLYNLVLVENIASAKALERIAKEVQQMIKQGTPIRFGIVPAIDDTASMLMAKVLDYVAHVYGKSQAMAILEQMEISVSNARLEVATEALVESTFQSFAASNKPKKPDEVQTLSEISASRQDHVDSIKALLKRLSVPKGEGVMVLNGKYLEYKSNKHWTHEIASVINEQTQLLAQSVYTGLLGQDDDVYTFLMTQPHVHMSRNPFITVTESNPLHMLSLCDTDGSLNNLRYLATQLTSAEASLWVVADLNTVTGLHLALMALTLAESNEVVRVALIHTGTLNRSASNTPHLSDALEAQTELVKAKRIINDALALHKDDPALEAIGQDTIFVKDLLEQEQAIIAEAKRDQSHTRWADILEQKGLKKGFSGLVFNGRVIGPIESHADFAQDDYEMMLSYESKQRLEPIQTAIKSVTHDTKAPLADLVLKLTSLVEAERTYLKPSMFDGHQPFRSRPYKELDGRHVSFTMGRCENAFLEIGVVLDPLSETAQKWSAILDTLRGIDGICVEVYLNPVKHLEELPIKRFYRFVFDREPHFDTVTGTPEIPMAYFANLPVDALYTLGVHTINAWHVTVRNANMDLDNIRLDSVDHGVSATYALERVLIEGHCIDSNTQGPPRGLQFVLGTESEPVTTDTIVMANLGYFQLKAQPGVWNLQLRQGKSAEVYELKSVGVDGQWKASEDNDSSANMPLALTSFEGLTVFPTVRKRPGMEEVDVLESRSDHPSTTEKAKGFFSSISQKFFGMIGASEQALTVSAPKQADINIFSVASGQLYERFLSIMIVSVMEHTNSTVKFWFIENFLSPSFKDFVPEMAREYGFDYEMVTYKWPSWLRLQKEKQRTIWGYKILFLDVLFPLSLDKVIFVDADQIVRTDLKELVDMDLNGAPYGYTPFCSDRHEMDGFRFWTQGYWREHLRGRPYHISALYVVDLVRFRQLAAGDRLRAQYQQLSADPNSLANLDQDLPNNMQHMVPIHSLPQEWLWCETWCSDESLKTAKTIDLCNNPLTKEPKLDRARRQIPEWETYDRQVEVLRKRVARKPSNPPNPSSMVELPGDTMDEKETNANSAHPLKDEL